MAQMMETRVKRPKRSVNGICGVISGGCMTRTKTVIAIISAN